MNMLTLYQNRIEKLFEAYWHQRPIPEPLYSAMRYATQNGGKRFRPALVWIIAEALALPEESVTPAALAIEMVHCYSLVHDDLPAMDNDALRRGKPTVHIQFNEATAILAGDALLTEAFELLSHAALSPDLQIRQLQILTHAAGSLGMVAGQMLDMRQDAAPPTLDELIRLHELKTGMLIQAALLLGASPSQEYASLKAPLAELGLTLGLAFQIQDDILEYEQPTETLGKSANSDAQNAKTTFPALLGLEGARQYRDELIQQAHSHLARLPFRSPVLQQVIDFVAERAH